MTLEQLNQLDIPEAKAALLECCGSSVWLSKLMMSWPFFDAEQLRQRAEEIWWDLTEKDWLEAFSKHPRIGATRQLSAWSKQEQNGMAGVEEPTLRALASLNDDYFERFGWIYIICATGKSAAEMLAILEQRLRNDSEEELRISARELAKIMDLRLGKLLSA